MDRTPELEEIVEKGTSNDSWNDSSETIKPSLSPGSSPNSSGDAVAKPSPGDPHSRHLTHLSSSSTDWVQSFLQRQGILSLNEGEIEKWRLISYWDADCLQETLGLQGHFATKNWEPLPFNLFKVGRACLRYFHGEDGGRPLDRIYLKDLLHVHAVFVDFSRMPDIMRPDSPSYKQGFFAVRVHALQLRPDSMRKKLSPVILVAFGGLSDMLKAVLRHGDFILIVGNAKIVDKSKNDTEKIIVLNGDDIGEVDIVRVSSYFQDGQTPIFLQEIVTPRDPPKFTFTYRTIIAGNIIGTDKFHGLTFNLEENCVLRRPRDPPTELLEQIGMGAPLQQTDNVVEFYKRITAVEVEDAFDTSGIHAATSSPRPKPKKRVSWEDLLEKNEQESESEVPEFVAEPRQRAEQDISQNISRITFQLDKIIWILQAQRRADFRFFWRSATLAFILLLFILGCLTILLLGCVRGAILENGGHPSSGLRKGCKGDLIYSPAGGDGLWGWFLDWCANLFGWIVHVFGGFWGNSSSRTGPPPI